MTHRQIDKALSKPRLLPSFGTSRGDTCLWTRRQPVYRRHDLNTGFSTERENLASDVKGNEQVADTMRKNTEAGARGGAARSSVETFVMRVVAPR